MVHRWRCRHCGFTVWSADLDVVGNAVKSHLVSHFRNNLSEVDFRFEWACPFCEREELRHDKTVAVERYKQHLFAHAESSVESGVHVADDIDRTGSVLVLAPPESQGANNARIHFLSASDVVVSVTLNPAERIQFLSDNFDGWPDRIVLLTPNADPLADLPEVDPSTVPLETVGIDGDLGLSSLGETISRVLREQERDHRSGKISLEFGPLPEVTTRFQLQQTFKFFHLLNARIKDANAVSHFYADPNEQQEASLNILENVFDMTITARRRVFTSETQADCEE